MTTALLVNPWIHDFSAYDMWMRPVGLLRVAAKLRRKGQDIIFYDCLSAKGRVDNYGCAKIKKTSIQLPSQLKDVQRKYYRYGVKPEDFIAFLKTISRPDSVYVTSGMTYWYPGVQETIRTIRGIFGDIEIILGGIYATLCEDHAKNNSGADKIYKGEMSQCVPAWDLLDSRDVIVVQTSFGCPFYCSYCGTHLIREKYCQRGYKEVFEEIKFLNEKYYPNDVAFYDDALLVNSDRHIKPLLNEIIRDGMKIRFHTPNGIHARFIDRELAGLMKKSGFATIRIGFETSKKERHDKKISNDEFLQAIQYLKESGFTAREIGVYTMCGSHEDNPDEILEDIKFVTEKAGVPIKIGTYSLVPCSEDFKRWGYSDDLDPLWHNKTVFPLLNKNYNEEIIRKLRRVASEKNTKLIYELSKLR